MRGFCSILWIKYRDVEAWSHLPRTMRWASALLRLRKRAV